MRAASRFLIPTPCRALPFLTTGISAVAIRFNHPPCDFGNGYSSLTYLKRLPVTMLKLDQSFVRDMLDEPDDLAILQVVIGLASAFRRDVIAKGVETVAHGALLLRLGCELAKGYGIAKPMPAERIPAWAAAWHPDAAWKNQGVISKEALPLLFAGADLRAWVASVIEFLKGDQVAAPIMDEHKRQIEQWIEAKGLLRYQGHRAYTAIAATPSSDACSGGRGRATA